MSDLPIAAQARRCGHRIAAVAALIVLVFACLAGPVGSPRNALAANDAAPAATAALVAGDASKSRFVADLTYAICYNVYVVRNPFRVIIDLPAVDFQLPDGTGNTGMGLIKGFRYGMVEAGRARIVMDVAGPVVIQKSFVLHPRANQPARLVVDLVETDLNE